MLIADPFSFQYHGIQNSFTGHVNECKTVNIIKRRDPITPFFGETELHSIFSKSKQSIQTVQHDGYVKMCLQIKFYIFFEFFYYLLR